MYNSEVALQAMSELQMHQNNVFQNVLSDFKKNAKYSVKIQGQITSDGEKKGTTP